MLTILNGNEEIADDILNIVASEETVVESGLEVA